MISDPMATPANLDAFLLREDFFQPEQDHDSNKEFVEIGLSDLKTTYSRMMRKPDFQRTTAAWEPKRIVEFIKSFVDGDLIPGVIFWNSPTTGNILVVDGAHRISALLAWIHNDYGNGDRSRAFIGFQQNQEQIDAAAETERLIQKNVGRFQDIWDAEERGSAPTLVKLEKDIKKRRIAVQWVRGDAATASESFFRINLKSVALDKTELKLIRDRAKPYAIATRAIVQNAGGHKFWKDFNQVDSEKTVQLAQEIHSLLFSPPLKSPITTGYLPIGGKAYAGTAMEVTLSVVEFANKKEAVGSTGPVTVHFLQKTWGVLSKVNGSDAGCLGLHPAVYFYSHSTGKHQPSALMAVLSWIGEFEKKDFEDFSSVRERFEDFLIQHSNMLGEAITRRGSRGRSVPTLVDYYKLVLRESIAGKTDDEILTAMASVPRLAPLARLSNDSVEHGVNFSKEVKSSVFITDALDGCPRCRICGARYQPDSVNLDHGKPKREGGDGSPENARPSHFYCNSNRDRIESLIAARRSTSA